MSVINVSSLSKQQPISTIENDRFHFQPLPTNSLLYRIFSFSVCINNQPVEETNFVAEQLKDSNYYLAFSPAILNELKSEEKVENQVVFKNVKKISSIVKKLVKYGHFGPFSLFSKNSDSQELQHMYEAKNSHKNFPYELHTRAISWPLDWMEFKFSPLYYVFPKFQEKLGLDREKDKQKKYSKSEKDRLQEAIMSKNEEQQIDYGIDLSKNQIAIRNSLQKDIMINFFENPKIEQYLASAEIACLKKCFLELKIVTYEELVNDLANLTSQLKNNLANKPYSLIFKSGKSSQWIAEIALPFLDKAPNTYLTYHTDTGGSDIFKNKIDQNVKDYVLFDDFAYSGDQIYTGVLKSLRNQLPYGTTLHLVVPYVSEMAKERWDVFLEMSTNNFADSDQRKLKILHSDKTFHSIDSLNNFDVNKTEFHHIHSKFKEYVKHEFLIDLPTKLRLDKTMAITEWKIADSQSIDRNLFNAIARTNGDPIYYKMHSHQSVDKEKTEDLPSQLLNQMAELWK